MPHELEEICEPSAIDRNLVRQLVAEHKNHIALLTTLHGDVPRSKVDHIDMVNAYMACLNYNDRMCFAMLYGKEMDLYEKASSSLDPLPII